MQSDLAERTQSCLNTVATDDDIMEHVIARRKTTKYDHMYNLAIHKLVNNI